MAGRLGLPRLRRWKIQEAHRAGYLVLVEGESDAWVLWRHDIPALGIPGSNSVRADPDGRAGRVPAARLRPRGARPGRGRVRQGLPRAVGRPQVRGPGEGAAAARGVKDPADLHAANPQAFGPLFKQALDAAVVADPPPQPAPAAREAEWEAAPTPLNTMPEVAAFPLDAFPGPVREFVRQISAARACPPDYTAVSVLVMAAAAIGHSRRLEIKRDHYQSACLFAAVVGRTGSIKTPGMAPAWKPAEEIGIEKLAEWKKKLEEFESLDEDYRALKQQRARKARQAHLAGTILVRPQRPSLVRTLLKDVTAESCGAHPGR